MVAVLGAIKMRDQSVVETTFHPATKNTGHCLTVGTNTVEHDINVYDRL